MQHQHLRIADLAQEVPAVQHKPTAPNAHGMDARRLQHLPRAMSESPKAVRAPVLALQLPAKALPAVRHDILVEKVRFSPVSALSIGRSHLSMQNRKRAKPSPHLYFTPPTFALSMANDGRGSLCISLLIFIVIVTLLERYCKISLYML